MSTDDAGQQADMNQAVCFRLPINYIEKLDEVALNDKRTRANLLAKIVTDFIDGVNA